MNVLNNGALMEATSWVKREAELEARRLSREERLGDLNFGKSISSWLLQHPASTTTFRIIQQKFSQVEIDFEDTRRKLFSSPFLRIIGER